MASSLTVKNLVWTNASPKKIIYFLILVKRETISPPPHNLVWECEGNYYSVSPCLGNPDDVLAGEQVGPHLTLQKERDMREQIKQGKGCTNFPTKSDPVQYCSSSVEPVLFGRNRSRCEGPTPIPP